MNKKTILGLAATAFALVLALSFLQFPASPVDAQSGTEVRGWAWSDNIGWVSFDSDDYDGVGQSYGVTMDSEGKLSGYAWSLNLGWIKFDPALYDSANCSSTSDCYGAKLIDGTPKQLRGWARVCSVYVSGCSGTLRSSSELGGWNGWIRMYNVTQDESSGGFLGYAWGDLNMGWLNLSPNFPGGDCDSATQCCEGDTPATNPNCNVDNCPVALVGNCCPAWQTCGDVGCDSSISCCPGDTFPENSYCEPTTSDVTVVATTCTGMAVDFYPIGSDCGSSCRSYNLGDTVMVTFAPAEGGSLPTSVTSCPEAPGYNAETGICEIPNIDTNYNLVAVCSETDITQCEPRLDTSPTPLRLSENSRVSYPAFSNNSAGVLDLVNVATGNDCNGISYDLNSETFKYVSGIPEGSVDSTVYIVCEGSSGYSKENCQNLTGGNAVKVKAKFDTRPVDKSVIWHLQMTAIGTDGTSQVFGAVTNNQLIQYSRRFGSK